MRLEKLKLCTVSLSSSKTKEFLAINYSQLNCTFVLTLLIAYEIHMQIFYGSLIVSFDTSFNAPFLKVWVQILIFKNPTLTKKSG